MGHRIRAILLATLLCAVGATAANAQTFPGFAAPNQVVAGPASGGSSALPTPRGLVNLDLGSITALPSGLSIPSPTISAPTISGGATLSSGTVTGLAAPANPSDAATKQYVDSTATGLVVHTAAVLATAAALPTNTYNNGTAGVGATLTANANGNLVIDGTTNPIATTRIIVKNEATAANNGIYVVTTTGGASQAWVLTRATDANTPGTGNVNEIGFGTYVLVTTGTANAATSWIVNSTVTTIGTSAINWAQFGASVNTTVSNSDGTLTISPTSGAIVASLNLAQANNWSVGANFAGNVGVGTTAPSGVDANSSVFLTANNSTAHKFSEISMGGNGTSIGDIVGGLNFYNSSLGTADKRVAAIFGATSGATNSGSLQFVMKNAGSTVTAATILPSGNFGIGTASPAQPLEVTGNAQFGALRGYADLREFATLSCNSGAPVSTNVAAAVYAANQAGYTHFFMPAGCFLYTGDAAWTAHFTANVIPNGWHFLGEDWNTSGISVCATYTGCTPGVGTTIQGGENASFENIFVASGSCYNVDAGAFGNPAYCPIGLLTNNGNNGGDLFAYPFQPRVMNVSPGTVPGWTNGADSPAVAINQTGEGDVIFSHDTTNDVNSHFFNFVNNNGAVVELNVDGKLTLGNTSTSHSGSGMITITDAFASCGIFTNTSGSPGFACSSDRRLKQNIIDDGSELPWLKSLRIRQYEWRKDSVAAVSPVAQELQKTNPDMVRTGEDGYLQIFSPNPWKMVKAMQEMQAEIEVLRASRHWH